MTDKLTGIRVATAEIAEIFDAPLIDCAEEIEAIILRHCPEGKAVGKLVEALEDIDKRKGLYKGITFKHLRDQLNYANDTIDKMTRIARTALAEYEELKK